MVLKTEPLKELENKKFQGFEDEQLGFNRNSDCDNDKNNLVFKKWKILIKKI